MSFDLDDIKKTRRKLNRVSKSFCLAKWLQVTIHLQNGQTHSCHHPNTHGIRLKELARDPSALHNTQQKKRARKAMLEGKRPKECEYCWKVEDSSCSSLSDRHIKSSNDWAVPYFNEVKNGAWNENVTPTYLEVSFSHICNMKCSYCSAHISSSWMDEIKKMGPYPIASNANTIEFLEETGKMPLDGDEESNPYVQAFWRWWPELYPRLKVFRITGGEPLLTKNTLRVLDYVYENPRADLELSVNSNLCIPKGKLDDFMEKLSPLVNEKKLGQFTFFTSLDAWGRRAEYIRHGLRHEYFWKNVERFLEEFPQVKFVFMSTINALSVTSYQFLLERILDLKARYPNVFLDTSYLRYPEYQSFKILTSNYVPMFHALVKYMEEHCNDGRRGSFYPYEVEKMRRLYELMLRPEQEEWLAVTRADFFNFFAEHDRRRGTDFLATFPEMSDFWNLCELMAQRTD